MSRFTPILMYHEIAEQGVNPEAVGSWTVAPGQFAAHLEALSAAGYVGVSVPDWLRGRGGGKPVVLTFDDGCAGNIEHALPLLASRGWTATFFVISGRMGSPGFGGPSDWRAAAQAGMDVGSHTASHPFMGVLSEEEAARELCESRKALQDASGADVSGLSWPNGDAHPLGHRLLSRAGYVFACTSMAAFAGPVLDPLAIPRLAVRNWHDAKGLLRLVDTSLTNRLRMAAVWRVKASARAMLGRKRYADIQMGFRDDA